MQLRPCTVGSTERCRAEGAFLAVCRCIAANAVCVAAGGLNANTCQVGVAGLRRHCEGRAGLLWYHQAGSACSAANKWHCVLAQLQRCLAAHAMSEISFPFATAQALPECTLGGTERCRREGTLQQQCGCVDSDAECVSSGPNRNTCQVIVQRDRWAHHACSALGALLLRTLQQPCKVLLHQGSHRQLCITTQLLPECTVGSARRCRPVGILAQQCRCLASGAVCVVSGLPNANTCQVGSDSHRPIACVCV